MDNEDYLLPYRQILKAAFPTGVERDDLEPLMSLIYINFSQRNLARLIAEAFDEDCHDMLNLVFGIDGGSGLDHPSRRREIRSILRDSGWTWPVED